MPDSNQTHRDENRSTLLGRREVLLAGAGLLVAPLLTSAVAHADTVATDRAVDQKPFPARAFGNTKADRPLGPLQIERRAVGPNDVLLDVLYCGICHSDIHQVRDEWS